jgi:hypothetical protein
MHSSINSASYGYCVVKTSWKWGFLDEWLFCLIDSWAALLRSDASLVAWYLFSINRVRGLYRLTGAPNRLLFLKGHMLHIDVWNQIYDLKTHSKYHASKNGTPGLGDNRIFTRFCLDKIIFSTVANTLLNILFFSSSNCSLILIVLPHRNKLGEGD